MLAILAGAGWRGYVYFNSLPSRQETVPTTKVQKGDVLIRAYSRCKKRGGRFALCEMRPAIKHLFEMLQLYRICEHYDTEAQAIAAIGS